jgi:hypothetical protein
VIDYLKEENRILREQMHGRRLRFSDEQRRRLATPGKVLGRGKRGPGRPRTTERLKEMIVRFAKENPGWGYTRLRGTLRNLGHVIGRNTIKRILTDHGF